MVSTIAPPPSLPSSVPSPVPSPVPSLSSIPSLPGRPARRPFQATDARGLIRLGFDATAGITGLVQAMHHTIASGTGIIGPGPQGEPAGVTGLVYRSILGTTRLIGSGLDRILGLLPLEPGPSTPEREAMLAALNGVWGDHLEATHNPLAIRMSLRSAGLPWNEAIKHPTGRILVLVHGLSMNDLQWQREGHDHGAALARDLGFTPLYLHYNSGRHVYENGAQFSALLEDLIAQWPVPVRELVIIGHSMGGLVARSACQAGAASDWRKALSKLVCLGTPHHGAPLERGGKLLDQLLGFSPYIAPFARLGKARSAGITDLRFGNIQPGDLQGRGRHAQLRDERLPCPLPTGVRTCLVAATTAEAAKGLRNAVVGDGLVRIPSALGQHANPDMDLHVPTDRTFVLTKANHWDLLSRDEVYQKIRLWLA